MSTDDVNDLRKDIQVLAVNVAVLTQRFDDQSKLEQPCRYLTDHLKDKKEEGKNADSIKQSAIKTAVNMVVVAVGTLLLLGFLTYVRS